MPTTTYKLGRDAVAELPGVENCDIVDVTVNVSADQLNITTFGTSPITKSKFMAGLIDISIDVMCTAHDAAVGVRGTCGVASIPADFDAIVLDIKESSTPQGKVEFTLTYGLIEAAAAA